MHNLSLVRNEDGTDMVSHEVGSGMDMHCFIGKNEGGDGTAKFVLEVKGGQTNEDAKIEMIGQFERSGFLPFLKQVVREMELLENKS